jgi:hypothetical protein
MKEITDTYVLLAEAEEFAKARKRQEKRKLPRFWIGGFIFLFLSFAIPFYFSHIAEINKQPNAESLYYWSLIIMVLATIIWLIYIICLPVRVNQDEIWKEIIPILDAEQERINEDFTDLNGEHIAIAERLLDMKKEIDNREERKRKLQLLRNDWEHILMKIEPIPELQNFDKAQDTKSKKSIRKGGDLSNPIGCN